MVSFPLKIFCPLVKDKLCGIVELKRALALKEVEVREG